MMVRLLSSQLLAKLMAVIVLVIVLATLVVWVAIDFYASHHFTQLLGRYKVPDQDKVLQMFLESAHRGLIFASLGALIVGLLASFIIIRMILAPLYQMMRFTGKIAQGNYDARLTITSRDEIGELGAAFNAMTDNLQRIEQLRKKMVVDVAHELRGPLTNIRGYLEALESGVLTPNSAIVEALHEETLRLRNLSDDLLRLSVADSARLTLRREPTEVSELIERAVSLVRARFDERNITIDMRSVMTPPLIDVDRDKLAQVAHNLLDNACRYAKPGGRLRISIDRVGESLRFVFANTGEPISTTDLPLIFERFYTVDKSRSREHGGAGIGLAIVKELVEAHGGQVGAEHVAGENRMWFTLPA